MPTVFANGRSILHAGDGVNHVAAPPDVCKTPSPAGPVPIPYVNVASDSDLADGTTSVQIEGKSVAIASANLSTSKGDEPGTAGGLISSKNMGKLTWATSSADVKFEGKGVVRFMDVTQHNGNTFNTAFQSMGGTGLAYGDDFQGQCPICDKGPKEHRILEKPGSAELCARIVSSLREQFNAADDAGRKRFAKGKARKWRGYMVGVMVCKCSKMSFAAMSGDSLPGFDSIAGGIVDAVISGGGASIQDMALANTSSVADQASKIAGIKGAFDRIGELRENREASAGYNYPGSCAGAKLLGKSGHAPEQMSEAFFSPPPTVWSATYDVMTTIRTAAQFAGYSTGWRNKILQNRAATETPTTYTDQGSVASCHTCQETLFMTMCPEKTC